MASSPYDIEKAVEAMTSLPFAESQEKAARDLLQYLSENLPPPPPVLPEAECLIVMDTGLDGLLEALPKMVPAELQLKVAGKSCRRLSDVVSLLSASRPAALVITANFFVGACPEVIAALVATNPDTRCLVLAGYEPFVRAFQRISDCLPSRVWVIEMPFSSVQLETALRELKRD